MKSVFAIVAAAAALVMLLSAGGLGQPETKPAGSAPAPAPKAGGGLDSLAFLKGTWSGKMGEDWVEETWSAAHGDSIIGMFRWQVAGSGQTTMWEMLAIKQEAGKPVLRLRHFDAKFEPWKSESGSVEPMPAAEMSATRVLFVAEKGGLKSVEYKSPKADVLAVTVSFRDESRPALEFELKKQ